MIHFRLRDHVSILAYRLMARAFAALDRRARIVWPLRIVGARYCAFGADSCLQYGAYVAVLPEPGVVPVFKVGEGTQVGNHAHIVVTRRVEFGRRVLIADRFYVADNRHAYENPDIAVRDQGLVQLDDVHIGDGSWIGENVSVIGCRIGRHCVVAANSVVTRDVPDHCVVVGAPARIVKRYCPERRMWLRTEADGRIAA